MDNNFDVLKQYQVQAEEYWVAGLVRLPGWVDGDGGKPYRLWMGLCTSRDVGLDYSEPVRPERKEPAMVAEALLRHAERAGHLPSLIHVWEEPVGEYLQARFKAAGISVQVGVGERHPVVDAIMADMAQHGGKEPIPGLLSGKGVSVGQIKRFAEATVEFCTAQPWRVFDSDEDLIKIESPETPTRMRYCAVLGRAGQEFGIAFYQKPEEFFRQSSGECTEEELARRTTVYMSLAELHELPDADANLWEDHGWPLHEGRTMLPAILSPKAVKRPDREMLALMEGVMRAVANSGEADLDAGTWQREVATEIGVMRVKLSCVPRDADKGQPGFSRLAMEGAMAEISRLMAEGQMEPGKLISINTRHGHKRQAVTPQEQAQEKIYAAWEASGRASVKLAREALKLWPDAADAYNILAREYNSAADAKGWYEKALAAGERALGQEVFDRDGGHFWGALETRPYMRALEGLAWCQWKLKEHAAAIASAQRLLELNPNDNQGVRYALIAWLLSAKRDQEVAGLIKAYEEESAWWGYGKALLAYRLGGDCEASRKELKQALRANHYAPAYLTGEKPLPFVPPDGYSGGDVNEAIFCAKELAPVWQADASACQWLRHHARKGRKRVGGG